MRQATTPTPASFLAVLPSLSRGLLLLLLGLLLATFLGCQDQHKYSAAQVREAAKQFAFPQAPLQKIELLLDSSASMRGFALAAVQNEQDPVDSWQSLFVGIDSLSSHFAQAGNQVGVRPAASQKQGPPPDQHIRLIRFGGSVEPFSGPASLVQVMLGMQPVTPIGHVPLSPTWRSRPCGRQSPYGDRVHAAIDSLFSERETCLGLAFDRATAPPSDTALRIVLTDSEQAAAADSLGCPTGNNPASTQERLYDWVHNKGRYGAIAVFRLPYQGWRVQAPTQDYCRCASRNLFAYLLGPSADVVEESYRRIADRWRGAASEIAYLPLAPRPAAQYAIKMIIPKKDGDVPASIDSTQQTLEPESGQLPMFHLRLDEERAVVSFELSKVALEDVHLRRGPSGTERNYLSKVLAWRDQPSLLEASGPTKGSGGGLRLSQSNGTFEFVRLPGLPKKFKVAHTRDAWFLSKALKAPERELSGVQTSVSWEVRKRQGAEHACEIYLFELYARGTLVERLIAETPLLQSRNQACSGLHSIAAQVRHVYQETPIARFLFHVDG